METESLTQRAERELDEEAKEEKLREIKRHLIKIRRAKLHVKELEKSLALLEASDEGYELLRRVYIS